MNKVTRVEVQKKNKKRYSIFLDDEYGFSVSEDVLVRYRILKGSTLERDFIDRVLLEEEKTKGISIALRYLGHRMRSRREIEEKLVEKGYDDFLDEIMIYLEENGYIDDVEFARCYARDKSRLNSSGKNKIRMELIKKGIDSSVIDMVLDEEIDSDIEFDSAEKLALKKINTSYKDDSSNDIKRKVYAYLYRRGYSSEIANRVLKKVL